MESTLNKLIEAYKRLTLLKPNRKYDGEIAKYRRELREMIYVLST